MRKICGWWGVPEGQCVRCGFAGYCERAHVIDRVLDGLDHEGNMLPLCRACHHAQPSFASGEEVLAFAWFLEPPVDRNDVGADADVHRLARWARWTWLVADWVAGCRFCWALSVSDFKIAAWTTCRRHDA